MIKLGSDVNMGSMFEEKVSNMCIISLITCYNPNCDVISSIALPSKVDLS